MKSLEKRLEEREQRKEDAKENRAQQEAILATGTLAEGKSASDSEDEGSYSDWTVAQLKEELDNRKVEYNASDKKADLVAALEADDEG